MTNQPSSSASSRRTRTPLQWALISLALCQVLFLLFVLAYTALFQDESKIMLEQWWPEDNLGLTVKESDIVDTCSLLSGPVFMGLETPTEVRRNLAFSDGQMMWFVLDESLKAKTPLMQRMLNAHFRYEWMQRFEQQLSDGTLNFLYDAGSVPGVSLQNWQNTAVPELQASPLLPWAKKLDFVVVSTDHFSLTGLPFIADLNPGMLFLLPPCNQAEFRRAIRLGGDDGNILTAQPGVHPLCRNLWTMVLACPQGGYELDLIRRRHDGTLVVFSGASLNSPRTALDTCRQALGETPAVFVGTLGAGIGFDTEAFAHEVYLLKDNYPQLEIIPSADTSMTAYEVLCEAFGSRVRPGKLGTRIKL